MNDPNGCVYFNGLYHLYYQHHPHNTVWGPMHWGHAVSKDLLHWRERPISLYPDERLGTAFSGSAVADLNNDSGFFPREPGLLAFYTTHLDHEGNPPLEQQNVAWSRDGGESWIPWEGNPVIPNPGIRDFRDPKVFRHEESGVWIMVVAAGREVRFYRSENFLDWDYASSFGKGKSLGEGLWECPNLFPMIRDDGEELWILVISSLCEKLLNHSPVQYFCGQFDGHAFTTPKGGKVLDYGHDFYATQDWSGVPDGRRIWIGWASNWVYANEVPTHPWRGVMSLPRTLSLGRRGDDAVLKQNPVEEIEGLRVHGRSGTPVESERAFELTVQEGEAQEIFGRWENSHKGSLRFVFRFGDLDKAVIAWDGKTLSLDRSPMSASNFHPNFGEAAMATLENAATLELRITVDRSLLEIYAQGGEYVFTSQIFPSELLSGIACAVEAPMKTIDFYHYRLRSIWSDEGAPLSSRKNPVRDFEHNPKKEEQDE